MLFMGAFAMLLFTDVKADSRLINKLDIWDIWTYNYNASHWIEQANLHAGTQMYGDAPQITISSLPATLEGADWIQTAYGSKAFSQSKLATFELAGDADVFIVHNRKIDKKPDWLKSYNKLSEKVENSTGEIFDVYKRSFKRNDKVSLGSNGSMDHSMYSVAVKPIGNPPALPKPTGKIYDIVKFGAKGDNQTVNTVAIQKAIDACTADGGGSVYIHDGIYVTGTLELKDNVTLFVQAGSILRASSNHADYPQKICAFKYYRGNEHYQLIYAEGKKNIGITGGGIIDGFSHGDNWPWRGKSNEHERPRLIRMVQCTAVNVRDITLIRPANWTQLYEACDNVKLINVRVRAYTGQHNQDGIDISSCNGVEVKNFYAMTGDDAICLKAMSQKPTENIFVDGVVARYANCNAVKIGTETHGDVKNVHVKNVVANTRYSIAIEAVDGSNIDGVTYENILLTSCSSPLFIRAGDRGRTYEGGPKKAPVGSIKNVTIRNVRNTDIGYVDMRNGPGVGAAIGGIPDSKIENLLIEDCDFLFYGSIQDTTLIYTAPPENRDKYPEFNIYGTCPAYGLYLRHVDNVTLKNVSIRSKNPDVRPAIVMDDVDKYNFSNLNCEEFPMTQPAPIWHKQKDNPKRVK
ncbi:glycoside hydrolase family 28 [Pseudopedobacter saltans DSM 12145]|uniref:Glycoside hydrolase family 28 n=2 Tax=Pseudopedobacter saltans TaxID=151895 RepID=F0S972_PSESL|nr:glycoside hydrolase family 28 [Pseudopedobacter saltans DSM 12145]